MLSLRSKADVDGENMLDREDEELAEGGPDRSPSDRDEFALRESIAPISATRLADSLDEKPRTAGSCCGGEDSCSNDDREGILGVDCGDCGRGAGSKIVLSALVGVLGCADGSPSATMRSQTSLFSRPKSANCLNGAATLAIASKSGCVKRLIKPTWLFAWAIRSIGSRMTTEIGNLN